VDEFELIRRYFTRDAHAADVIVGIGDDGAVLSPEPGTQQVQVIDTVVEGVHFPPGMAAADIGYRVVAVNLSDLAAMGAR
jgi:thiamine-monophosphate kinase